MKEKINELVEMMYNTMDFDDLTDYFFQMQISYFNSLTEEEFENEYNNIMEMINPEIE